MTMTTTNAGELDRIRAELAVLGARWKQESEAAAERRLRLRIKSEIALEQHHKAVDALKAARSRISQ